MNISTDIHLAAQFIKEGKLVAFPTETVYGLGADALNPIAVAKIFEIKERPSFDPLIVHIAKIGDLELLTAKIDERVYKLTEIFWPGPLTIILPKAKIVPDIVTSGLSTVGIRMPSNEIALNLILASGSPIAAPSANKFGRISPTKAEHVKKQLPDIDFILDGGRTTVGIESTIMHFTDYGFQILRNGIITQEEIEKYIPFDKQTTIPNISAPGMLESHYSPRKPLFIAYENLNLKTDKNRAGIISFTGTLDYGYKKVIRVSMNNDLREYAVNMFAAMHSLEDDDEIDIIVAEPVQKIGIGKAIMDRLVKAEYKNRKIN